MSNRSALIAARVETLEPRQLLTAASSTDVLAQVTDTHGLRVLEAYVTSHPKSSLAKSIDVYASQQLFRTRSSSTLQLSLKKGVKPAAAIKALEGVSGVKWASPNYTYGRATPELTPNDPRLGQQSAMLNLIKAPQAWDTTTGAGVTVAVLDDGVDLLHPDLAGNIWTNPGEIPGNGIDDDLNGYVDDVNGWDFGSGDNNVMPEFDQQYNLINSHGTTVSGVIAALMNNGVGTAGIAGGAKIMPVRFNGYGVTVTSAGIAQSLAYAANNGAKVINVSFSIDPYQNDPAFYAATDLVYEKGVLWINSAGNAGVANPPRLSIEKAIFIANTRNDDVRYSSSNWGTGIDLSAPGVDVWGPVPNGGYQPATGTSFSTAVTSGVAALIWAQHPQWTRDQVVAQLLGTADNIDALNPTLVGQLGTGRVNALRAVSESLAAPTLRGLSVPHNSVVMTAPTQLTLGLFSVLDVSKVTADAFELRYAGADGVFDAGDTVVPMTLNTVYAFGTNQLKFALPALADGNYRFVAKSSISDPFGTPLDGNRDGYGGDAFVSTFAVGSLVLPPAQLAAVTPSYSQTEAALSWVDTSLDETGFVIQRSQSPTFDTIEMTRNAAAGSNRYNDWGLQQGKTYYYRARSVTPRGESAWSNTATLVTPMPTGTPATPGSFAAVTPSYSTTEAALSWVIASHNETGFVIERSLSSTFDTIDKARTASAGTRFYNDWGLVSGQTYYYRIKAVNGALSSGWSDVAMLQVP